MMYPLVQDLAVEGVPVGLPLTCRLLGFSKQSVLQVASEPGVGS